MERAATHITASQTAAEHGTRIHDRSRSFYHLIRPWIFRLDPEDAHVVTQYMLHLAGETLPGRMAMRVLFPARTAVTPVQAFGLTFPNCIGLAAGYDKNGLAYHGLSMLGFGHVEIGTVTPRPQNGNPKPRVYRLVEDEAAINRMGFPNQGAEVLARRLRGPHPKNTVIGVNIGKNGSTPLDDALEDYLPLVRTFAPLADYLAINVSCPNIPDMRSLQTFERLHALLAPLAEERDRQCAALNKPLPILVKLAPDLGSKELDGALQAISDTGMDGVILSNTTTRRDDLTSPKAKETGGLSGRPLRERSTELVRTVYHRTAGQLPIVASGGVMNADDAQAKLDAGATLVQLYTGLVYEGPGLVNRIIEQLG